MNRFLHISSVEEIPSSANDYDEILIDIGIGEDDFTKDSSIVSRLIPLFETYDVVDHDGRPLLCKMCFGSQIASELFKQNNLCDSLASKVEFWPYTHEELWAQRVLASSPDRLSFILDREAITFDSLKTVHLVIIGMSSWAEALAKTAALVCHFPNYTRDTSLRTRITIIDESIDSKIEAFSSRYKSLFDNSYVRTVQVNSKKASLKPPKYHNQRDDFVDIEWEFVNGRIDHQDIQNKLSIWSNDPHQLLSLAICFNDDQKAIQTIKQIPSSVIDKEIPVLIRLTDDSVFRALHGNSCFHYFGMSGRSNFDITRLRRMAIVINYVYNYCYSINAKSDEAGIVFPSEINYEAAERMWWNLSQTYRFSSIYHALAIPTKMRSLNHGMDFKTLFSVDIKEIDLLSEVEHNRWSTEVLLLGFRPVTDEEQKAIEHDISLKRTFKDKGVHFDLRSYRDLRSDETGKRVDIYDACLSAAIPLIVASCESWKEVDNE